MAQRSFVAHTAMECTITLAYIDGLSGYQLPDDFFAFGAIYDKGRKIQAKQQEIAVWNGVLRLQGQAPETPSLAYYAYWPDVVAETVDGKVNVVTENMLIPAWSELPLAHLAIATLMQPKSIQSAMNREYNIKIDSGTPDDNARRTQAREHLWWYRELLSMYPAQSRKGAA
jgi:hypothetical protein